MSPAPPHASRRRRTPLRAVLTALALTAAGRVVGETMTDDRQRRLVQEFLASADASGDRSN